MKTFFNIITISAALLISTDIALAQTSGNRAPNPVTVNAGSVNFRATDNSMPVSGIETNLSKLLGLNDKHTFVLTHSGTDKLGITHNTYQQYFNGIAVDGNVILIHAKEGIVRSINGRVASIADLTTTAALKGDEALILAKNSTSILKTTKNYPVDLIILPQQLDEAQTTYTLAYKIRIDGKTLNGGLQMQQVFVDAQNGKILNTINLIKESDVTGTGSTFFSGTQTITVDSSAQGYMLRDNARKIYTLNAAGADVPDVDTAPFVNPQDFINDTRDWTVKPALMEINLTTAPAGWTNGLGVLSGKYAIAAVLNSIDTAMDLASWPEVKIDFNTGASTANLPMTTKNLFIYPSDTTLWGAFGKVNIFSDTLSMSDSIFFRINNIQNGVHQWDNGSGSNGTYSITNTPNPALDAHWGMEKTHDFYNQTFGRNSYDGNGSDVVNYMNGIFPSAFNQNNAAALPAPYFGMVYGTGDGINYNPFVSLDVMGHEFTHMVTETNGNGGLNYQGEPGALNESFSDIMGTCIEFFVRGANGNWDIGEELPINGGALRSMANPKLYDQPDTYKGTNWLNTNSQMDNGGVHINSGIQNKWFYLLSQGGTGTNDNNDNYNVTAIGIAKAQQIAYRNLTSYLAPSAQILDAYNGSLLATLDLYGNDTTTQEYKSVKAAWFAVGIPKPTPGVGVAQVNNNTILQLYPNPADKQLNIASPLNETVQAEIFNVVGSPVMRLSLNKGVNAIDITTLSKGIYLIRYNINGQTSVQKFSVL